MRIPIGRAAALIAVAALLTGCVPVEVEVLPTPSESPATSSPTAVLPALVDLPCDELLDVETVSALLGEDMTPGRPIVAEDPAAVGGVWCIWRGVDDAFLSVSAFPASAASTPPAGDPFEECQAGWCDTWQVQDDIWVNVNGPDATVVTQVFDHVAPKLAERSAPRVEPGDSRWSVPSCDEVLVVAQSALNRSDLGQFSGDNIPTGPTWDLLKANGAALWCGWHAGGDGTYADQVEVYLGPGAAHAADEALAAGWEPISVDGASSAAYSPADSPLSSRIIATVGENSIEATVRMNDREEQIALMESLIDFMASR